MSIIMIKDKPITCLKFVRPTPKNMCSRAAYLSYVDYGQIDGRGLLLPILLLPIDRGGEDRSLARRQRRIPPLSLPPSLRPSVKSSQDNKDVCYLWSSERKEEGGRSRLVGWLAVDISISIPLELPSALDIELYCTVFVRQNPCPCGAQKTTLSYSY